MEMVRGGGGGGGANHPHCAPGAGGFQGSFSQVTCRRHASVTLKVALQSLRDHLLVCKSIHAMRQCYLAALNWLYNNRESAVYKLSVSS